MFLNYSLASFNFLPVVNFETDSQASKKFIDFGLIDQDDNYVEGAV